MSDPKPLRGQASCLTHYDDFNWFEDSSLPKEPDMTEPVETLIVPKTITNVQADMLGMPKEYYEKAVAHASRWAEEALHTACLNDAPIGSLLTSGLITPFVPSDCDKKEN